MLVSGAHHTMCAPIDCCTLANMIKELENTAIQNLLKVIQEWLLELYSTLKG